MIEWIIPKEHSRWNKTTVWCHFFVFPEEEHIAIHGTVVPVAVVVGWEIITLLYTIVEYSIASNPGIWIQDVDDGTILYR